MDRIDRTSDRPNESIFVRKVWLSPLFYIYFLSVLIGLGMLYVHRENMVNRNSITPDLAVDSVYGKPISDVSAGSIASGSKIDVATLLQPTKSELSRGEELFKTDCSACHGADGKGNGPASASLNPKPRDFHSTTGWINGRLLFQMFKTVSEGIPKSAMVSFAGSIPASDRAAIINYIRSAFGDFPKDTPGQLETMYRTYHLDKIETPSAGIPVSEAMREIEQDAIPASRTIAGISEYISQHPTDEGSGIYNSIVNDGQRALTSLASSRFWTKSESDFVLIVTAGANQNGFDPKVARLNAQDWQTLYNYLRGLFDSRISGQSHG